MIVLILAGGEGRRLWPLSKDSFPKQFLNFGRTHSLLQTTVLRFINLSVFNKVVISTNADYVEIVEMQIKEIDLSGFCHIILEPLRKNTTPAIIYSLRYLEECFGVNDEELVLVIPSDHFIEDESLLIDYIEKVSVVARNRIVSFGVKAFKPDTGYGYIKKSCQFNEWTYEIDRFVEKPSLEKAKEYVSCEDYYWNCGIFIFSVGVFWEQLKLHDVENYLVSCNSFDFLGDNYVLFNNISIDYSIMEKTEKSLLCPLNFGWSDIGSWDSIYELSDKDLNGNAIVGSVKCLESSRNLFFLVNGRRVFSVGVEDLLVIDNGNDLVIIRRGESQKLKKLIDCLGS